MGSAGILPAAGGFGSKARKVPGLNRRRSCPAECRTLRAEMPALPLHNTLTQQLVFSGEQLLHEIVAALVYVL